MAEDYMGRIAPPSGLDAVRAEGRRVTPGDTQRLQEQGAYNRLRIAERDTIYRPTSATDNIAASKEYRTQLLRSLGRHDRKAAAKAFGKRHPKAIAADKQIAKKMFIAGYSPQQIQRAMKCGSPGCARMSSAAFNAYYRKHIQRELRSRKVQVQRQKMVAFKQQHGVPIRYRRMEGLRGLQQQQRAPHRTRPDPVQRVHQPTQSRTGYGRRR